MRHTTVHPLRSKFWVSCAAALLMLTWYAQAPRLAASETTRVACSKLTAVPSTDKSGYTFTAAASGSKNEITGYRFDFGDHQTYVFAFDAAGPKQNRNEVTVEHTYASLGVYTATVRVETHHGSRTSSVTSADCSTTVAYGPTKLLDTGAGNTPLLFTTASTAGLLLYQLWLRHLRITKIAS